jgi:hypothetical protein
MTAVIDSPKTPRPVLTGRGVLQMGGAPYIGNAS